MATLTTIPAKAGATCVDGIDVAQLLRDMGEASAATSAVDLFGLLLAAQRVLVAVQASSARTMTPRESLLLATYHAMSDAGQDRLASVAGHMLERFPRRRAALTLVPTNGPGGPR